MNQPGDSRRRRLRPSPGTVFTPMSHNLGRIICIELRRSKKRATSHRRNLVPIPCLPIMIAFIRSLAIEIENQKESLSRAQGNTGFTSILLKRLEKKPTNEIGMICSYYQVRKATKRDADILNQIRHEILHPSPYPEDWHQIPSYLRRLQTQGLLWTPPREPFACDILEFFCSHELLKWAAVTIADIACAILNADTKYTHPNTYDELIEEIRGNAV
jgi:hypothetical protein